MGAFAKLMETQSVNMLYIILDIVLLAVLIGLLIYERRYQAVIIGFCGGIFYFLADYFLFYQLMGVRQVEGGIPVWTILWNTMSVGFSMMAWIWLLLDQDEHSLEWSVLFVARWLCVALLSRNFGSSSDFITLSGGIWQFMGVMALLLLVGYGLLIFNNLKEHSEQIDIKGILMVGILVQFSQLLVFMLSGICSFDLKTLILGALLGANALVPYLWIAHRVMEKYYDEEMDKMNDRVFFMEKTWKGKL